MYKDLIFAFIPTVTIMIVLVISQHMNVRQTQYIVHTINDKVNFKTGSKKLDAYFISLGLIVMINLLYSIFGLTNFINHQHNNIFFYIFSLQHTLLCFMYGIYKKGILQIFNNFYYHIGNNIFAIFLGLIITILQIFINVIVNSMVIPTRLVINEIIGSEIHHALESIEYGFIMLCIVNFVKMLLYLIQSYIFVIMSHKTFKYLCE